MPGITLILQPIIPIGKRVSAMSLGGRVLSEGEYVVEPLGRTISVAVQLELKESLHARIEWESN